jgi:RND family efflux transporter MFP subunit
MRTPTKLLPTLLLCALGGPFAAGPALAAAAQEARPALAAVVVEPSKLARQAAFDAVVEAVRQTVVAAQVPGAVVELNVKAGDRVKQGQVLLRLDARAAEQNAAASDAQVQAARAALDLAARELERQRQLFQRNFISQAALDQAEAQFRASRAQAEAQLAQAGAARTQSGFYVVRAPFAGVVADVPVALGDMAMPGRALLTLYDPGALRVSGAVPQSVGAALADGSLPRIELPSLPADQRHVQPLRAQFLPTVDPATHTLTLRADLPPSLVGVTPGMYARLWLPLPAQALPASAGQPTLVPHGAVVRRAELTAVYVIDAAGKPALRLVRLGRSSADGVEVLSGLLPGERVARDAQAAARLAQSGAPAR